MFHVIEDYYISCNGNSYDLLKKKVNGKGEDIFQFVGNHYTLSQAFRQLNKVLVAKKLESSTIELNEFINIFKETVNQLEKILEKFSNIEEFKGE